MEALLPPSDSIIGYFYCIVNLFNLLDVLQDELLQEPSVEGEIPVQGLDPVGQHLPADLHHLGDCVGVARLDTAGSWALLVVGLPVWSSMAK